MTVPNKIQIAEEIAFCQAAPKAIASLDGALEAPPALVPRLLLVRMRALSKKGEHAEAAIAAGKLAECYRLSAIGFRP